VLLACNADEVPPVQTEDAGVGDGTADGADEDGDEDADESGDDDGEPERDAGGEPEPEEDGGLPPPVPFEPIPAEDGAMFLPVWNDEFEGEQVDTTKWYVQDGHRMLEEQNPWRRNWKASNVWVEDGALVIQTVREEDGSYSTGAVKTGGYGDTVWLFSQTYGRFEARAKLPKEQGHWAAFWAWTPGTDGIDNSGRDGSELDIFEAAFRIDRVVQAIHWDGYAADHKIESRNVDGRGLDDGDWHTFALEWYPDEYVFFVDGVESWRTTAGGVCQVPLYFKLTEEIGHYGQGPEAWGVGPIDNATLPDYYRVDYVRMWQYEPAD
jgi:beta-glucanase (GH16 family)